MNRLHQLLMIGLGLLCAQLSLGSAMAEGVSVPLKIGIFPRRDPVVTIELFKPLSNYLQQQLGVPVSLETAPDFKVFKHRLEHGQYDLVHFNQYHYVVAHADQGYEVIAQNEEFGEATIKGAIYVRRDSGITRLDQLRGKPILFGGGEDAMMSYIVPRYLLRQAGLNRGDYQERFATSPPNAVLATYMRQADAGGAGEVVQRLPLVTRKIDIDQMTTIAVSEPLAHLPWAVKPDMQPELRNRIRSLLLALDASEQGRSILKAARLSGFNPAHDEDYNIHRHIVQHLDASAN